LKQDCENVLFLSQPRLLPALLPAAFTEQQEAIPEPSNAQHQNYETSETAAATVVRQERF